MLNYKTCETWPSRVSTRVSASLTPAAAAAVLRGIQGYMEVCDECGRRYRRMSTERFARLRCGKCYPSPDDLVNSADSCQIVSNREALQRSD